MSGFSRDPRILPLVGIQAADLRSLVDGLTDGSTQNLIVAADLSLGAWRSHQIASEFRAQLQLAGGIEASSATHGAAHGHSRVGRLIDMETSGSRCTLEALAIARGIAAAVAGQSPTCFCVLAPRHNLSWEPGDALLVRFLAQALKSTHHRLVLVSSESRDPALPSDWRVTWSRASRLGTGEPSDHRQSIATLIPGIITPPLVQTLRLVDTTSLLALPGGCFLVDPRFRRDSPEIAPKRYDELAAMAAQFTWLAAYATYHRSGHDLNPGHLWEHARKESEAGGFGIAIRLLTRAAPLARTATERHIFELLAQSCRLANAQFSDAAECTVPDDDVPSELRGWLFHTKGWALTMLGRAVEAEPFLEQARDLLRRMQGSEEYLYLLNISALNRLKLGDWKTSIFLEQEIRSALDRVEGGRWQLTYINSLNLARLHKRIKQPEIAERYYREAFATTNGVRSDSDAIYMNVCQARLDEDRGRHAEAYQAWLRAALYWVSSPAPEGISRRVAGAILGPATWAEGNVNDDVSAALISHLQTNATVAGMDREASAIATACPDLASTFARPGALSETDSSTTWRALCLAARWLLGCDDAVPAAISSTANRRLRSALAGLVALLQPVAVQPRTFVVDDRLGRDMPATEAELLAVCLRLDVRTLVVDEKPFDFGLEASRRLQGLLRVRLSDAVDRVRFEPPEAVVIFKRYRDLRRLQGSACNVLAALQDKDSTVDEVCRVSTGSAQPAMQLLRELEWNRIIELILPDHVTIASLRFGG